MLGNIKVVWIFFFFLSEVVWIYVIMQRCASYKLELVFHEIERKKKEREREKVHPGNGKSVIIWRSNKCHMVHYLYNNNLF